jgi:hypothetical protein
VRRAAAAWRGPHVAYRQQTINSVENLFGPRPPPVDDRCAAR